MSASKLSIHSTRTPAIASFQTSPPCTCQVCVSYCQCPGWWTVAQAARAIEAGYASRMMLKMSPSGSGKEASVTSIFSKIGTHHKARRWWCASPG